MKKISYVTAVRIIATAVVLTGLVIATLCSCSANKYGCGHGHPKQNWNKMVRRINSPY
jgi:hypothetical protein